MMYLQAAEEALDDFDVLVHGVGRPEIPLVLGDALARRQDVEALVAFRPEEIPAHLQVPNQAVGLVLSGDGDATNTGVHRVGENEVDDSRLAAEIDGRLGAKDRSAPSAGCRVRLPVRKKPNWNGQEARFRWRPSEILRDVVRTY